MLDAADQHDLSATLEAVRAAAPGEDRGASVAPSMRRLLDLPWPVGDPRRLCARLVAVAEANLPAARLIEGHVNALHLIELYGDGPRDDGLHGVWGADGDPPLACRAGRLEGGKRYASGLGVVSRAVVSVGSGDRCRLVVVDVSDPACHRPAAWTAVGMRATLSGEVDLTGLAPEWLGAPGDYMREPHFVGGVWRIAALQLGGALGLLRAARDGLAARGRLDADAQVARLGPLVGRAMAAFGLVERAAAIASGSEGRADPERAVMLSSQARLLTEELAQDAVAAVERSLGLPHFDADAETGRIARDLATYCRQVARDAFEQRAGRIALGRPEPLSGLWHG